MDGNRGAPLIRFGIERSSVVARLSALQFSWAGRVKLRQGSCCPGDP